MTPKQKVQQKLKTSIRENTQNSKDQSNDLLQAILNVQTHFQEGNFSETSFEVLLENLLELSKSESAFITQVSDCDHPTRQIETYIKYKNQPPAKTKSVAKFIWNEKPEDPTTETHPIPQEILTFKYLLKLSLNSHQPIILHKKNKEVNFDKFLGLPIYKNQKLIALMGVANRKGGYNKNIINYLEPFILTCKNLIITANAEKQIAVASQEIKNNQKQLAALHNLEEDSELFKTIFNQAPLGIIQITPEGEWLQLNQKYCEILGYSREEIMTLTSASLTHPDDLEVQKELIKKLARGEIESSYLEKRYIHKNRSNVWVKITFSVVRYQSGEPKYYIGIVEDITERKKLKEELAQQKQLFDSFFKVSPVGMCIFNEQLQVVKINDALAAMSGPTVEEHLGKTIWEIAPELAPNVDPIYRQALNSPKGLLNMEVAGATQREPGVLRDWLTSYFPLSKDGQEKPIGLGAVVIEITDRKRAERQLQKLAGVIANSPDFMAIANLKGKAEFINEAGIKMVGLESLEEATFRKVVEYLLPEDVEFFRQEILPIVMQKGSWQGEFRFRHFKTGLPIPVDCNIFLLKDSQTGHPIALCTTSRDISERKQAEIERNQLIAALKTSEDRYRSLTIATSQIVWVVDSHGLVEDMLEWRAYTGQTPEQVKGWGWLKAIHPDDQQRTQQVWLQCIATGSFYEVEYRIRNKNGDYGNFWVRGIPIKEPDGSIREWVGICTDITSLKQTQETLQNTTYALEEAQRIAHIGSWNYDIQTDTITWSDEVYRIFGREPGQPTPILKEHYKDFHIEDQQLFVQTVNQAISQGTSYELDVRIYRPNGEIRYIETRGESEKNHQGQVIRLFGTVMDITLRKQIEENVQQTNNILTSIIESTPDFVMVKNFEGRFIMVNSAFSNWLQIPKQEIIGKKYSDFLPAEASEKIKNFEQQVIAEGKGLTYEIIIPKSNKISTFLTTQSPWRNSEGNFVGIIVICRDISEAKVAEITLREREQFLASIYDGVEFAIFVVDITEKEEFVYAGWNPMCERIMGLTSSIVIGKTIDEILPKEMADQFRGYYRQCIQAGVSISFEQEFPFQGQQTWWITTLIPLRDIQGKIYRIVGTTTEITERVLAEENLRQQKETLRAITDNAPIWIWMTNTSGKIQFINKTFCENTGVSKSRWLAASGYREILPPEVAVSYQASDLACLNQELPYQTEEVILFADGQPHELEIIKAKIKDGEGQVIGIVGLGVDVTQEKQAQRQLKQSENRFRKLAQQEAILNQIANQIRNSLDINTILKTTVYQVRSLLQVDRCAFVWYVNEPQSGWDVVHEAKNPELLSLLGFYPADFNNSLVQKVKHLEMYRFSNIEDIENTEEREFFKSLGYKSLLNFPLEVSNGNLGVLSCASCTERRIWHDEEVELILAISVQISIAISQADLYKSARNSAQIAQEKASELEAALTKLQQTQTQLIQTEKMSSLGQMVAGIAHEINNPTNFIYGNIEHAKEYITDLLELLQLYQKYYPSPVSDIAQKAEETDIDFLAEDLPKILASMKIGATRIRDIVKSLRTFSRLDEADMKEVDIHEGIESTLLILEHRLKKTGIAGGISLVKNYGQLPLIECYAGQLNQVFMNILANAIDALESVTRGREFQPQVPEITITTGLNKEQIFITIKDNGPGMTEEVKQRLFDPFFTTKPVGTGTGLGMSISYQIIEKHNGQLECVSSPGKGAEFWITLPVKNRHTLH